MRTNSHAFITLGTQVGVVPYRDEVCDAPFLVLRGSGREGTIYRKGAHRKFIPSPREDFPQNIFYKRVVSTGHHFCQLPGIGNAIRIVHFLKIFQRAVHRFKIHLDDSIPFMSVCPDNGILDLLYSFFLWKYSGYCKETGLQDGVGPFSQFCLLGNARGVNYIEFQFLLQDFLLHFPRKFVPDSVAGIRGV